MKKRKTAAIESYEDRIQTDHPFCEKDQQARIMENMRRLVPNALALWRKYKRIKRKN